MEEVLMRLYESYRQREIESTRHLAAPGFRFHMRPGWPGREHFTFDEMPQVWADLDDTFTEYEMRPVRFHAAEAGYALVELASSTVVGGERITDDIAHVWRFEDGLVAELWTFNTVDEARAFISARRSAA
jgi:hypothetical protein